MGSGAKLRVLVAALAAAFAAAAAPSAHAAVVAGDQTVESSADYNAAGLAEAFRTTASATGTVSSVSVYVDSGSAATTLAAGLYADAGGHPGALLAKGTVAAPKAAAWNTVSVGAASVTSGTAYWIALLSPAGAGTLRFRDRCCGAGSPAETSAQTTLAALPATWTSGSSYKDGPASAYASTADAPSLVVTPSALSFAASTGGAAPAAQDLSIVNGGSGSLSWTASTTQPWLSVQPASGAAPATAAVSVSPAGLAAGSYSGSVTIDGGGVQGSPATIPVTLRVTAPDTTPPSVSVTAPAAGATVAGTVTVTAAASDDVGVAGVQLELDGSNLGAEVTAPPYSVSWDTTSAANGQHTLTAVARDAAGNATTSAAVGVDVENSAQEPPTFLAGDQALEPSVDFNVAGLAEAYRTTASTSGTATSLQVYVDSSSTATALAAGLYVDSGGHPGALLAQGTTGSLVAGAWNTVPVAPTSVTSGTAYWIALLAPAGSGTLRFRDRCCGGGTSAETSAQTGLSALPSTWTTGGAYHDGPASAYAAGAGPQLPPADQVGRWSAPFAWSGVAVHAALLPTGKVISWDGFDAGPNSETLWDPASGTFTPIPYPRNLFCAGQAELADGRLLVLGGHNAVNDGLYDTTIYDPFTNTYTRGTDMTDNRWYPTVTTLPDGRAFVIAGDNISENKNPPYAPLSIANATLPEVYDPKTNTYQDLTAARLTTTYYPFMFVLPDGRLFDAGPDPQSRVLDPKTWTWSLAPTSPNTGASAVMYRPGKVMKSGTWSDPDFKGMPVDGQTAVIDMTAPTPAWRSTEPMAYPRAYEDLTLLPDGTVLGTGGTSASEGVDMTTAVLPAELWNPATETWTTMTAEQNGRGYHSTALLLPDGRVLVAGGGQLPGSIAVNQTNAEIFSPPYLFKGARPAISSAPASAAYGASFAVSTPNAASIAQVSLVRLGAVTHAFDQNQRFVPLSFTAGSGSLTVQAPANANVAPPGYYMLFVVNSAGVPSVATFLRLGAAVDTQPPTTPAGLTATGSLGSASLSWSASTDDVGVTGYVVYRSTSSGFAPSAATRVASVTGTSYVDSGLAAGTYYYRVTAVDAVGNASAPSAQVAAAVTADATAPTVSVTAPADGATVSGTVTVTASASDDVGVADVQLKLDGASLGADLTAPPYSVAWNTAGVANGQHTLVAVARDAAGNAATSPQVTVTVQNTAPPTSALLAGDATIEASSDSNAPGVAEAYSTSAVASGAVSRLSVYVDAGSTATSVEVGLYADAGGHPGALLAKGLVAAPVAGAWNTATVPGGPSVAVGTTYWLAILGEGGTVRFRDRCCGGGRSSETSAQSTLTTLPATWTSGRSYHDGPASADAAT